MEDHSRLENDFNSQRNSKLVVQESLAQRVYKTTIMQQLLFVNSQLFRSTGAGLLISKVVQQCNSSYVLSGLLTDCLTMSVQSGATENSGLSSNHLGSSFIGGAMAPPI